MEILKAILASPYFWIIIGIAAISVFLSISYVKAPPDKAYIISGFKNGKDGDIGGRVIVGKAAIRIPFFERIDKLPLNIMQVDIKTGSAVPTAEYINIFIDGVANVKVASDRKSILRAAQNFLANSQKEISVIAQQVLEGNLREIVGQMKLSELVQNRDIFAQKVQENASKDMQSMGLEIVNLTIQNFVDKNGVIENLGVDNVVQISKNAAISRANAERDIAVSQARATEESNKAKALAESNIAEQNKVVSIKKSEYQKEMNIKKAEADASYSIQEQEQRKTIETASVNADIAKREKEVELQEKEIMLAERKLDSTVRKQADADKYVAEKNAEALRFSKEQEALSRKYVVEQEAEASKALASAKRFADEEEAFGIKAKGEAEAQSILKKAEAMKIMGDASIIEMYLSVLPEIVKNVATPLSQTDKIVMYGEGNSTKLVKDIMQSSNQIMDGLKEATGIDLSGLISSFTKSNSNIN